MSNGWAARRPCWTAAWLWLFGVCTAAAAGGHYNWFEPRAIGGNRQPLVLVDTSPTPLIERLTTALLGDSIPVWLCVILAALLAAGSAARAHGQAPIGSILFVAGVTLRPAVDPGLLTTTAVCLYVAQQSRSSPRPIVWLWIYTGWTIMLVSLGAVESGVPLLWAPVIVGSGASRDGPALDRRSQLIPSAALAFSLGLCLLLPTVGWSALLRPIAWIWLRPDPVLFPSSAAVWQSALEPADLILLGLIIGAWCLLLARGSAVSAGQLTTFCLFTTIGLGCRLYLVTAAALALHLATLNQPALAIRRLVGRSAMATAILVLCLVWFSPFKLLELSRFAAGPATQTQPEGFEIPGVVMLANLDQAPWWRIGRRSVMFRLLLDERWDRHADRQAEYRSVLDDFINARVDAYRRADGSFGGYSRWLQTWNPSFLAVPSERLGAIRQLSLNHHWRIVGIDAVKTLFARRDDGRTRALVARASRTLQHLEWPIDATRGESNEIVIANSAEERSAVARVLCSVRLPYAALRILTENGMPASHAIRSMCYAEIAHRVRRNAGVASLLDEYRASAFLDRLPRYVWGESASDQDQVRMAIFALRSADLDRSDRFSRDELLLRQVIAAGHPVEARRLLPSIDVSRRGFFEWLLDLFATSNNSPLPVMDNVASRTTAWPNDLASEAFFYVGCLGIESGESRVAIEAFTRSAALDPGSPLRFVRDLHLATLGSR